MKRECVESYFYFDSEPIEQIIQRLKDIAKDHPDYRNFELRVEWGYEDVSYSVWGERDLTEQEIKANKDRAAKAREQRKKAKERKEEKERQEYERLKKKYGGIV